MPKSRDTAYGFTMGFWDYGSAVRYARHVAVELGIPAIV